MHGGLAQCHTKLSTKHRWQKEVLCREGKVLFVCKAYVKKNFVPCPLN